MLRGLNLYTVGSTGENSTFKGSNLAAGTSEKRSLGQPSITSNNDGYKTYAFSGGSTSNIVGKNNMVGLLDGFINNDLPSKRRMYEDIYRLDPIAGSAVDIMSSLPFSSFDLTAIDDEEVLEVYQKSCDNLQMKTSLPGISRDYLTFGVFIGTTLFDKNEKIFTNIMPQNINNCTVTEIPIYGVDPIIDLNVPPALKKMLSDKDPRLQKIFSDLPKSIRGDLNETTIKLPPETTLYIPRRTLTSDFVGTSYLERMLPIHLYEKTLYRGTLDQANRRQRAILHIIAGDDEWIPPQEDLNNITEMFMKADSDPTGAIITTRTSIQPNEIRSPTDFFRYDEVDPYFAAAKYRALNISESLVTGEFSISTLDATLSVLVDSFRAYREMLTRAIFYDKIFPAIAIANNFKAEDYVSKSRLIKASMQQLRGMRVTCEDRTRRYTLKGTSYDTRDLAIPSVEWHKHLKPEGDTAYIELLNTLADKGLPITLGMYAGAAGLNLDSVVKSMEPDLDVRQQVAKYLKKVNKINADLQPDEQEQVMQSADVLAALASRASAGRRGSAVRQVGLLNREFDDRHRLYERKKNGGYRLTSARRQREMTQAANAKVAEALQLNAKKHNKKVRKKSDDRGSKKILSSAIYGIVK